LFCPNANSSPPTVLVIVLLPPAATEVILHTKTTLKWVRVSDIADDFDASEQVAFQIPIPITMSCCFN
jgi:hypothetical protein